MGNSSLTGGSATFSLDPETVKEVVRASIMQSIDEDSRERLIAGAIEYLMTQPPKQQYGPQREAPLTETFNQAIHQATREMIFEEFKNNPEVKKAIEDVVHPMVVQLCEGNYDDGLSDAIGNAFGLWLAERKPRDV